ncbi:hypothetical protein JTS93_17340 [Clostridium botulinum]|nr:hypothetical protein [Clostridium botulinum]
MVIFNEDDKMNILKRKKLDRAQEKIYDSDLESAFTEKRRFS